MDLKEGEFKRFNDYCGIAKLIDERDNQEWFVVYSDYMNTSYDLGTAIGRGKTYEEAMIQAIKNLNKYARYVDKKIEKFEKEIRSVQIDICMDKCFKDPIFPIESEDWIRDEYNQITEIKPNGKYVNADVGFDKGKAFAWIR